MHDSIDDVFEELQESDSPNHLYEDLAPLYDYIYAQHYDYTNQLALLTDIAPQNTTTVLEGACGTGRLTEFLVNEYPDVISVDLNDEMLNQARARAPEATFVHEDLRTLDLEQTVDMFSILGTSIIHLAEDGDFQQLATRAADLVDDNGVFVFDFIPIQSIENGKTGETTFCGDKFTVHRKHLTVHEDNMLFRFNFSFELTHNESGETVTTGDSLLVKGFDPTSLEETLHEVGFSEIRYTDSSEWSDGAELTDLIIAVR